MENEGWMSSITARPSSSSKLQSSSSANGNSSSTNTSGSSSSNSQGNSSSGASQGSSSSAGESLYDLTCEATGTGTVGVPLEKPKVKCVAKSSPNTAISIDSSYFTWLSEPKLTWRSPTAGEYAVQIEIDDDANACPGLTADCGTIRIIAAVSSSSATQQSSSSRTPSSSSVAPSSSSRTPSSSSVAPSSSSRTPSSSSVAPSSSSTGGSNPPPGNAIAISIGTAEVTLTAGNTYAVTFTGTSGGALVCTVSESATTERVIGKFNGTEIKLPGYNTTVSMGAATNNGTATVEMSLTASCKRDW